MLHAGERGVDVLRQFFREQQSQRRIQFIDFADGLDALAILVRARAVAEAGGAGVAGAGVDFG